jgi:hypothetical protein
MPALRTFYALRHFELAPPPLASPLAPTKKNAAFAAFFSSQHDLQRAMSDAQEFERIFGFG